VDIGLPLLNNARLVEQHIGYGSLADIGSRYIGTNEHRITEIGCFERGFIEVCLGELGIPEVGPTEVGPTEVSTAEVGIPEIGIPEIGPNAGTLDWTPPLIPRLDPLPQDLEMLLVGPQLATGRF